MIGSAGCNETPFLLVCVLIYSSSLRGGHPSSTPYMCFTLSTQKMQHVSVLNKTQIQFDIPFYALNKQSSCYLMYDVWSTWHGWLCLVSCEPMTNNIKFYKNIVEFIYQLYFLQILWMPNTLLDHSNHHHSVFHHVFSLIAVRLICHKKLLLQG